MKLTEAISAPRRLLRAAMPVIPPNLRSRRVSSNPTSGLPTAGKMPGLEGGRPEQSSLFSTLLVSAGGPA